MMKENKVSPRDLTRADVIRTAKTFRWRRKITKWTAIVEGRELPARPLVLEAAGVPPNDPTNSHQAVDILKRLGFETCYSGGPHELRMGETEEEAPRRKGWGSILEIVSDATKEVPESAWEALPTDFAKNIDHYLYGTKKQEED